MSFEDDLHRVEEHVAEAQRILWLLESNLRRFEHTATASEQREKGT
jgi:hypothetical protein